MFLLSFIVVRVASVAFAIVVLVMSREVVDTFMCGLIGDILVCYGHDDVHDTFAEDLAKLA